MSAVITCDYQGHTISYQADGWFNATAAAEKFGRRVDVWLKSQSAFAYL